MDPPPAPTTLAARKPMYEDHHDCCSVMLARIRNEHRLTCLSPKLQFTWLHRFYLVVDRVAEQHKVYKVYGGPQGFMVCANVAEEDSNHADTLYRFLRHLMAALKQVELPGRYPVDLVLAVTSGAMSSGLLGALSLTYQLVGQPTTILKELVEGQQELNYMFTSSFLEQLDQGLLEAADLRHVGEYRLGTTSGVVTIYTLAADQDKRLHPLEGMWRLEHTSQPSAQLPAPAATTAAAAAGPATPAAPAPLAPAAPGGPVVPLAAAAEAAEVADAAPAAEGGRAGPSCSGQQQQGGQQQQEEEGQEPGCCADATTGCRAPAPPAGSASPSAPFGGRVSDADGAGPSHEPLSCTESTEGAAVKGDTASSYGQAP